MRLNLAFVKKLTTLGVCLTLCMPTSANSVDSDVTKHDQAVQAYQLINQRVALSMSENTEENDLQKIDDALCSLGVEELSFNDIITELGDEIGLQILSEYPNPGSNDEVHFYGVYDYLDDGQQIYSLICSPYEESSHSGNNTTGEEILTSYVTSGAKTEIDIYGNLKNMKNIYSDVSYRNESLYDIFSDFLSNSVGQVSEYVAEMRTRTVTMFVYSKNDADEVVYYGSTNCVHTYIDHTVTKNTTGSPIRSTTTYDLILAEDYYDFPVNVVSKNPSGYGVVAKYSHVKNVIMDVGNDVALRQSIPCYTSPIQAAS